MKRGDLPQPKDDLATLPSKKPTVNIIFNYEMHLNPFHLRQETKQGCLL